MSVNRLKKIQEGPSIEFLNEWAGMMGSIDGACSVIANRTKGTECEPRLDDLVGGVEPGLTWEALLIVQKAALKRIADLLE